MSEYVEFKTKKNLKLTIDNVWRNDNFKKCRLKYNMNINIFFLNENNQSNFINFNGKKIYLHFHWIGIHLTHTEQKTKEQNKNFCEISHIDYSGYFTIELDRFTYYCPLSSIRTLRMTNVHVLKSLCVTDKRSLFVMTCS